MIGNKVLANGYKMPEIGFGTYLTPDGDVCAESVKIAIECGYRQIDTAEFYQNENYKSKIRNHFSSFKSTI